MPDVVTPRCAGSMPGSAAPPPDRRDLDGAWAFARQVGVYALVDIVARLTAATPLAKRVHHARPSLSPRPDLDLTYQVLGIGFSLAPVARALFLLSAHGRSAVHDPQSVKVSAAAGIRRAQDALTPDAS